MLLSAHWSCLALQVLGSVSNDSPTLHSETTNEGCVEGAPCLHCHCRTDVLQWVLTAPFRNCHCTNKPQPLKGQGCSKLIFTNIIWALYFMHPPSLLTSLCTSCACRRVVCMADKDHCRVGVFYQLCFAKENFKEKYGMDVSVETPLTSWIHCLAFSDPCQVLLYDEVWKELHSDFLRVSRSTLSYWHNSVNFNVLMYKHIQN